MNFFELKIDGKVGGGEVKICGSLVNKLAKVKTLLSHRENGTHYIRYPVMFGLNSVRNVTRRIGLNITLLG